PALAGAFAAGDRACGARRRGHCRAARSNQGGRRRSGSHRVRTSGAGGRMTDHIHPSDKADALRFACQRITETMPESGLPELDRTRLYILQELAREADLEARK